MKFSLKIVLMLLCMALVVFMVVHSTNQAAARTIYVDDDAPQDEEGGTREHPYNTIHEALEDAVDGDTIRVYNGSYWTYYHNVHKEVSLIGNGSGNTTLDLAYGHGGDSHVVDIYADWVNISGFTITRAGNNGAGIQVTGSNNVRIFDNVFSESSMGVYLRLTTGITLENNTFLDGGLVTSESTGVVLSDNSFREKGVSFGASSPEYLDTHTLDTSNTINERPIYYLSKAQDLTLPSGAGQVILASSTGVTVTGQDCRNASVGIFAGFSSHLTIEDNDCSGTGTGLVVIESEELILANNTCLETGWGIRLVSSHNNTLQGNVCPSGSYGFGIRLEDSNNNSLISNHCLEGAASGSGSTGIYLLGSGNILRGNRCTGMSIGIMLEGSHNVLEYNICLDNSRGMILSGSGNVLTNNTVTSNVNEGIHLWSSRHVELSHNIVQSNGNGVSLANVSQCQLSFNTITGNGKGIWIQGPFSYSPASNLSAHNNNIFGNTEYGIDAVGDEGYSINATGNWWGDGSGPYHEANNTGGSGDEVTDHVKFDSWLQELIKRVPMAYIDSVSPDPSLEGEAVHFLAFGVDDTEIDQYVWTSSINGVIYRGALAGMELDNLSLGSHTLTLRVRDEDGWLSEEVSTTITIHRRPVVTTFIISPEEALDTTTISFTGMGSDDGTIVRYAWRSSLDGEFYNGSAQAFTNASLSPGTHAIHFKIQDNHGVWSEEKTTTLAVYRRPVAHIDSITPSDPQENRSVLLIGSGTGDAGIVRYVWTSSLDDEFYNGSKSELLHPGLSQGVHIITFRVQDGRDIWSLGNSTTLTVAEVPEAVITSMEPGSPLEGDEVEFSGEGVTEGRITRYTWHSSLDGEFYNGTGAVFTYSRLSPGTHIISLRVRDDHDVWSDEVSATLTVTRLLQATIKSVVPNPAREGDEVEFSGAGAAVGSITHYAWRSSLDGEFYNGTRKTIPYSELSAGTHTIFFRVQDNNGIWSLEEEFSLVVERKEDSKKISWLPLGLVLVGLVFLGLLVLVSRGPRKEYEEEEDGAEFSKDGAFLLDEPSQTFPEREDVAPEDEMQDTKTTALYPPGLEKTDHGKPGSQGEDEDDDDIILPLKEDNREDEDLIMPMTEENEDDDIILPLKEDSGEDESPIMPMAEENEDDDIILPM